MQGIKSLEATIPEIDIFESAGENGYGSSRGEMTKTAENRRVESSLGAIQKTIARSKEVGGDAANLSWDNADLNVALDNVEEDDMVISVFDPAQDLPQKETDLRKEVEKEVEEIVAEKVGGAVERLSEMGKSQMETLQQIQVQQTKVVTEQAEVVAAKKSEVEEIAVRMQQLQQRMFADHGERSQKLDEYVEKAKKEIKEEAGKITISNEAVRALTEASVKAAKEEVAGQVAEVRGIVESVKEMQDRAKEREDLTVREMAQLRLSIQAIRDETAARTIQQQEESARINQQLAENSNRIGVMTERAQEAIDSIIGGEAGEPSEAERVGEEMRGRTRFNYERIQSLEQQVKVLTEKMEQMSQNGGGGAGSGSGTDAGPGGVASSLPTGVTPQLLQSVCKKHTMDQDKYWRRSCAIRVNGEVMQNPDYDECKRVLRTVHMEFLIVHSDTFYVSNSGLWIRITYVNESILNKMMAKVRSICIEKQYHHVSCDRLVPTRFIQAKQDLLNIGKQLKYRGEIKRFEVVMRKGGVQLRTIKMDGSVDYHTVAQPEPMEPMEQEQEEPVAVVEEERCSVCQDPISDTTHGELMTLNKCGHKGHKMCLSVLFLVQGLSCAVCRQSEDNLDSKVDCEKCKLRGVENLTVDNLRMSPCGHLHHLDCQHEWFQMLGENWRQFQEEDLRRFMTATKIWCFHCTRVSVPEVWPNIGATVAQTPVTAVQTQATTGQRQAGGVGRREMGGRGRGFGWGRGRGVNTAARRAGTGGGGNQSRPAPHGGGSSTGGRGRGVARPPGVVLTGANAIDIEDEDEEL